MLCTQQWVNLQTMGMNTLSSLSQPMLGVYHLPSVCAGSSSSWEGALHQRSLHRARGRCRRGTTITATTAPLGQRVRGSIRTGASSRADQRLHSVSRSRGCLHDFQHFHRSDHHRLSITKIENISTFSFFELEVISAVDTTGFGTGT